MKRPFEKSRQMSFYAASIFNQAMLPVMTIAGACLGVYLSLTFSLGWGATIVVLVAPILALSVLAWYAYGFVLSFDDEARRLRVHKCCYGIPIAESEYSFDDIESVTLKYDGDGFAIVRLTVNRCGTFWFYSWNTEMDYRRLLNVLGNRATSHC